MTTSDQGPPGRQKTARAGRNASRWPTAADQEGDLLQRDAAVGQQRDEAVPWFARGPVGGVHPGRVPDGGAEVATHVGGAEQGAVTGGEDQVSAAPA